MYIDRYHKRCNGSFTNDNLPDTWIFMHEDDPKDAFKVVQCWLKDSHVEGFADLNFD